MRGKSSYKRTDTRLEALLRRYAQSGRPINIDFRKEVNWIGSSDRVTHQIHPYPAKLLVHIPHFFLANEVLSKPGDVVLDPFCGSGTVLLESQLMGRESLGADINPMARLIASVKTRLLAPAMLRGALKHLAARLPKTPSIDVPDVVNHAHWFYPHVSRQLTCIREAISQFREPHRRDFFLVCFSQCVRKVSRADPRLTVPVRLRYDQYPNGHCLREKTEAHLRKLRRVNVWKVFEEIVNGNLKRMEAMAKLAPGNAPKVICEDARRLQYEFSDNGERGKRLPNDSVQLIITSPPYAGAQKYIRAVSLSLGWLGLVPVSALREHKARTIGREEFLGAEYARPISSGMADADVILAKIRKKSPIRAHIAGQYLKEMEVALAEAVRVLKPEGYLVLIAGNNTVCGYEFKTVEHLRVILEHLGLTLVLRLVDVIRSRGLMTKRNKTASIITREWVLVFRKEIHHE